MCVFPLRVRRYTCRKKTRSVWLKGWKKKTTKCFLLWLYGTLTYPQPFKEQGVSLYRQSEAWGAHQWGGIHHMVGTLQLIITVGFSVRYWNDLYKWTTVRGSCSLITGQTKIPLNGHLSCIYCLAVTEPALFQTQFSEESLNQHIPTPASCL